MKERWPAGVRWARSVPTPRTARSGLHPFVRPIGLDVIVTPEGETVLVELQHGFGRKGLVELFPQAVRWYRQRLRQLKRERGPCSEIVTGIRKICSDKVATYRAFGRYQPESFVYLRWDEALERWLDELDSELVIAKPPRGANGKGIRLFDRVALRREGPSPGLPKPAILQAFMPSRKLEDEEGHPHVGCIRHVVVIDCDGERIRLVHMPSYWRVAPSPVSAGGLAPSRDSLTANISRGAYPVHLTAEDSAAVYRLAEQVVPRLVVKALGLVEPLPWESLVVPDEGGDPVPTGRAGRVSA